MMDWTDADDFSFSDVQLALPAGAWSPWTVRRSSARPTQRGISEEPR